MRRKGRGIDGIKCSFRGLVAGRQLLAVIDCFQMTATGGVRPVNGKSNRLHNLLYTAFINGSNTLNSNVKTLCNYTKTFYS